MINDVEADFWKDIMVHLSHKNMMNRNAQRLSFNETSTIFYTFKEKHPELGVEISIKDNCGTLEFFVTQTVKLRVFIQNQIKLSFMQENKGDFIKLSDAKFPYNPFEQIEEFVQNIPVYKKQLSDTLEKSFKDSKKNKIAGEFIKANLEKMFKNSRIIWKLETSPECFVLTVEDSKYELHCETFFEELNQIHIRRN